MVGNLALLHRYTLVRTHVKIGDHHQAAKLLIQVAANISRFPARKRVYDFSLDSNEFFRVKIIHLTFQTLFLS